MRKMNIKRGIVLTGALVLTLQTGIGVKAATSNILQSEYDYDYDYDYDVPWYGTSSVVVNEDEQSLVMLPGESYQITYNDPSQIASVLYTSDDVNVATVSETGVITMVASGQTTIRVSGTDISGYSFSGEVYLYSPQLSTTAIQANLCGAESSDGYYYLSDEVSLDYIPSSATVMVTTDSTNLEPVYTKSYWGAYVAFKVKQEGNYNVTITVNDKAFPVTVKVRNLYFDRHEKTACDLESYNPDKTGLKWQQGYSMLALYKGESATLHVNGLWTGEKAKWSSSNKSVATVNSKGKVTAKGYGAATITVAVGDFTLTYEVGVSYKTAIKALRYGIEHFGSTYSQEKRMEEGYYDCSSFVWRAYKDAGKVLNQNGGWAPTAADLAQWCVKNNCMVYEGNVDASKLLPGDLVFECDSSESNGRYKGIYHVDMYQGNNTLITVERQKGAYGSLYNVMVARPCVAMGNVTAKKSGKSIKLSWDSLYGAKGYKVYRSTSANGKYKAIATVKDAAVYKDTTAKKGITYYYKVRAYWKNDGHTYYSKYSAVVKKKR